VVTHRHNWLQVPAIRLQPTSDWPNSLRSFMRGDHFFSGQGFRFGGLCWSRSIGSDAFRFSRALSFNHLFSRHTRIYGIPFSTILQDLSSWATIVPLGALVPITPLRGRVRFGIAGRR
jgi:hypothetical protein